MAAKATVTARFAQLVADEEFLLAVLVHAVNNRVQDFPDPLTSTLILMASNSLQLVFCESGLLLFRTTALPVVPFDKLSQRHRQELHWMLTRAGAAGCTETFHGCGKYTVAVHLAGAGAQLPKRHLLTVFVQVMTRQQHPDFREPGVMRRLCDIVLQRFLSSVTVPSDDIRAATQLLWRHQEDA